MTCTTAANAQGIATHGAQRLIRRSRALIQPFGICKGVGGAKWRHFARHVCAKLQSAIQVLDDLTASMHFLATTVDVGRVG